MGGNIKYMHEAYIIKMSQKLLIRINLKEVYDNIFRRTSDPGYERSFTMQVNSKLTENDKIQRNPNAGGNNNGYHAERGNAGNNRPDNNFRPRRNDNDLDLSQNNMGIKPKAFVYDVDSTVMQYVVMQYLIGKINKRDPHYLETNDIILRCVTKRSRNDEQGGLPWQFIVFRKIQKGKNFNPNSNIPYELAKQLTRVARNLKDVTQFELMSDDTINEAIANLSPDPRYPKWRVMKEAGNKWAVSELDSTKTTAFLFGVDVDEDIRRITIDVLRNPKSRIAYNKFNNAVEECFNARIAIGKTDNRPKARMDLAQYIR